MENKVVLKDQDLNIYTIVKVPLTKEAQIEIYPSDFTILLDKQGAIELRDVLNDFIETGNIK